MAWRDVQKRLNALGFDAGPVDGLYGRRGEAAIMSALNKLEFDKPLVVSDPLKFRVVPIEYMPMASMQRIIAHWSAGSYRMWSASKKHYHLCVEGDPVKLLRGANSIKNNEHIGKPYAAHTRGINTGSIGISTMCMANAKESPFDAGNYPFKKEQWDLLVLACADLCERYHIEPTPTTLLSHAEVQANLGVWQRAKWDYTRLPFDLTIRGARAIGDRLRDEVKLAIKKGT